MKLKLTLRSIGARNERINGKANVESLRFMEFVKSAPTEELANRRQSVFMHWQRAAIDREIERRNKKESEGKST